MTITPTSTTATFASGCFWCTEAIFKRIRGVSNIKSGYTGGKIKHPTYLEICSGLTGHTEAIQFIFDPTLIDYDDLLAIFFYTHDPTTLNRQGNDVGTQYRSVIFYHDEAQAHSARSFIEKSTRDQVYNNPIVTAIQPATVFYEAESYHQDYYDQNTAQPYCSFVIGPKLEKLRKQFLDKLKNPD
ncbi:MAG TPA: peptide-methionine (S)-S-oxide reductase MsrA [Rhodothermales bacterium]|nr:peptide-methionine (S)-S-oxide reductase [Bacteroidota bacterium]HRK72889.1 peptide-methionine (S)-S-oxide reductase MsrA [Rhodothermales bacterium]HRR09709.1 peptide-methionine (S)-S-oxide reductase MsrA [Rhodothermales bacterium]